MDKIPDEILLIAVMVLVVTVSRMVRRFLPYDPGDEYYHEFGDHDIPH